MNIIDFESAKHEEISGHHEYKNNETSESKEIRNYANSY